MTSRRALVALLLVFVTSCARERSPADPPSAPSDQGPTHRQTENGPSELRLLQADPLVGLRAPGTALRSQQEQIATEPLYDEATATPSRIDQVFDMDGDPAETVDAYRSRALDGGWRLLLEGCSRYERATGLLLTRSFGGYEAHLRVRAQLENPVPERERLMSFGAPPELNDRHLRVTFGPNFDPVTVAPRNHGPDCLRGLDPSDPDLAWPRVPGTTGEALCARLPLDPARSIQPGITVAVPDNGVTPSCSYLAGPHLRFSIIEASLPRAYYHDRREFGSDPAEGAPFLWYASEHMPPAAWIPTDTGPLVVSDSQVPPSDRLSDIELRLIAVRIHTG